MNPGNALKALIAALALAASSSALARVPSGTTVTVELSVDFIDHAAHETIEAWKRQHVATGGAVDIHGDYRTA